MDTLIDNRNFPPEMQEQRIPPVKKDTPWLLIILVVVAVGIIVFLICRIFAKKDLKKMTPQEESIEEQVKQVNLFEKTRVKMTEQEKKEKVRTFFGK